MKFDVKPVLTVGGASAQDVSAACNLKFNHEDNEINVRSVSILCTMLFLPRCLLSSWLLRALTNRDLVSASSLGRQLC